MSRRPVGITRRRFLGTTAAMGAATVLDPVRRMALAQGSKPTISFWNGLTGADGKVMGDLIGQFTKETGIQVELQMIVWPDLYAKLQVSTPAGEIVARYPMMPGTISWSNAGHLMVEREKEAQATLIPNAAGSFVVLTTLTISPGTHTQWAQSGTKFAFVQKGKSGPEISVYDLLQTQAATVPLPARHRARRQRPQWQFTARRGSPWRRCSGRAPRRCCAGRGGGEPSTLVTSSGSENAANAVKPFKPTNATVISRRWAFRGSLGPPTKILSAR